MSWRRIARLLGGSRITGGRARRTIATIGGVAVHSLIALSSSDAQHVQVAPLWCNQHGGTDLMWVTENATGSRPYELRLTGNPGADPAGGVAWLTYFTSQAADQGVYFVPNEGARVLLPPVKMLPVLSHNPADNHGTISLPPLILEQMPDEHGVVGHLAFELRGVVTDTVPLYWPTTDVTVQAITPLPEWDPLEPTRARAVTPPPPRQLELRMQFRGCPPIRSGIGINWNQVGGGVPYSKARMDRIDSAGTPGMATLWVDEASLHTLPFGGRARPDWIYVYASATDTTTVTYFRLRRAFSATGPLRPSRIDLGSKDCWYRVDVDYTGGHPISHIAAHARKGSSSPREVRWRVQRRLSGGALLQLEIPAHVAIEAGGQAPGRVWVHVEQPAYPGMAPAGLEVPVVNVPTPASAALPEGGCDWSAPSKLPAQP